MLWAKGQALESVSWLSFLVILRNDANLFIKEMMNAAVYDNIRQLNITQRSHFVDQ